MADAECRKMDGEHIGVPVRRKDAAERRADGMLEAWDPGVYRVMAAEAEWEPLAGGFRFVEGPAWVAEEQALYFTDIPADTIYRWEAQTDRVSPFRRSSHKANGLTRDPRGFLLACEHGTRSVSRLDRDGLFHPVATHYAGRRLNSPNDIVVDREGAIWFTDPTYGIDDDEIGYRAPPEQPVRGVYRVAPSGQVELMVDDMDMPNGLAFSPDGEILYVADTARRHLRHFQVGESGHLADRGVFLAMDSVWGPGVPDGLRVTATGELFVTGPGGIWIVDRRGHPLGLARTPEVPANCELGRLPHGLSLFITARTSLYRVTLAL